MGLLKQRKKEIVASEKYFVCVNKECDALYFNYDEKEVYRLKDINIQIGFKKNAEIKYICYCNLVTEQEILFAIKEKNAKSIKDINKLTGSMKNPNCKNKNPLGKCCGENIQKIIDQNK